MHAEGRAIAKHPRHLLNLYVPPRPPLGALMQQMFLGHVVKRSLT
jgi:hypothetical protein